jgi:hypothetical protein
MARAPAVSLNTRKFVIGVHERIVVVRLTEPYEIDPQAVLQRAGHSIGAARQLLVFDPDLMVRLLQADQSALLEAP